MVAHADNIDARIRELHAAGMVDREIAERVGYGREFVRTRRNAMGLPSNGYRYWTSKELQLAVAMASEGKSHPEIGVALGRTESAVAEAIAQFGYGHELDPQLIRSQAMRSRAWSLFGMGKRPSFVARELGVTPGTARKYRRLMPAWWADKNYQPKGVAS